MKTSPQALPALRPVPPLCPLPAPTPFHFCGQYHLTLQHRILHPPLQQGSFLRPLKHWFIPLLKSCCLTPLLLQLLFQLALQSPLSPPCFTPLLLPRRLTPLLLARPPLSLNLLSHPALPARLLVLMFLTLSLMLRSHLALQVLASFLFHHLSLKRPFHRARLVPPKRGGTHFSCEQRPRLPATALHSTSEEFEIFKKSPKNHPFKAGLCLS